VCLILFALGVHPDYPLVLAGNRDEFYDRPTAPAAFWADAPEILAGRDLLGGGTWLGITRAGRLATVANYRQPNEQRIQGRSRGALTVEFLRGAERPTTHLETLAPQGRLYKGFNLLLADAEEVAYYSNREEMIRSLGPGVYGISNAFLDSPWPKVVQGKRALQTLLASGAPDSDSLFAILADTTRPPDHLLPDTGVGLERERLLSPPFIVSADYGTRCSTVVLFDREGRVTLVERSFERSPDRWKERRYHFTRQS